VGVAAATLVGSGLLTLSVPSAQAAAQYSSKRVASGDLQCMLTAWITDEGTPGVRARGGLRWCDQVIARSTSARVSITIFRNGSARHTTGRECDAHNARKCVVEAVWRNWVGVQRWTAQARVEFRDTHGNLTGKAYAVSPMIRT
jgi:hypothetical protein